jgi:hypothetical protein
MFILWYNLLIGLKKDPIFKYFIVLAGFQLEVPFVPSLLVEFRKRLTEDILMDINEFILCVA